MVFQVVVAEVPPYLPRSPLPPAQFLQPPAPVEVGLGVVVLEVEVEFAFLFLFPPLSSVMFAEPLPPIAVEATSRPR
jgi:hypothetical protein